MSTATPRSPKAADLPLIGWREWVALPKLGVERIKAKVDTGARSSSLHAFDLQPFRRRGRDWVRFLVHPQQRSAKGEIEVEAPVLEHRLIRSSNGKSSERPVIVTPLQLLGCTWPIELTLASRDEMGFRMLLGREAVRRRFLIDAGGSYFGDRDARDRTKAKTKPKAKAKTKKTRK